MSRLRRRPAERAQAWVVMGPLGHLWSVVADVCVYNWRRYTRIDERRKSP